MGHPVTAGALYVVSTPIGNLDDLSRRAIAVLRDVSVVVAEDTRHTRHLLTHEGVQAHLESLHAHNEAKVVPRIVRRLLSGESVALVSDAGTPLVSDPGERLVRAAIDADVRVIPVPGASAVLAALVASGFSAVPFSFFGFVPRKGRERSELTAALARLEHTAVCYESPERVGETLATWAEAGMGTREVVVARELTKRFEEVRRGTVAALAAYYTSEAVRGEIVLVLAGASPVVPDEAALLEHVATWRSEGVSPREIVRRLTVEHNVPRNLAYRLAHA